MFRRISFDQSFDNPSATGKDKSGKAKALCVIFDFLGPWRNQSFLGNPTQVFVREFLDLSVHPFRMNLVKIIPSANASNLPTIAFML